MSQADKFVDYLNSILEADPSVVDEIFLNRVPCSEALKDHKSAQVQSFNNGTYSIGALGIINGFLGLESETKPYGPIAMAISEDNEILQFVNIENLNKEKSEEC